MLFRICVFVLVFAQLRAEEWDPEKPTKNSRIPKSMGDKKEGMSELQKFLHEAKKNQAVLTEGKNVKLMMNKIHSILNENKKDEKVDKNVDISAKKTSTNLKAKKRPTPVTRNPSFTPSYSPPHHGTSYTPTHHGDSYTPPHHGESYTPPHHGDSYTPSHHGDSYSPSHHTSSHSSPHPGDSYSPPNYGPHYEDGYNHAPTKDHHHHHHDDGYKTTHPYTYSKLNLHQFKQLWLDMLYDVYQILNDNSLIDYKSESIKTLETIFYLLNDIDLLEVRTEKHHGKCPYGFNHAGNLCLSAEFLKESLTWEDARLYCQMVKGGDLAVFKNLCEYQDAVAFINTLNDKTPYNYSYWVGASDMDVEGSWKWVDGTKIPLQAGLWGTRVGKLEPTGHEDQNMGILLHSDYYYLHDIDNALAIHIANPVPLCQYIPDRDGYIHNQKKPSGWGPHNAFNHHTFEKPHGTHGEHHYKPIPTTHGQPLHSYGQPLHSYGHNLPSYGGGHHSKPLHGQYYHSTPHGSYGQPTYSQAPHSHHGYGQSYSTEHRSGNATESISAKEKSKENEKE